MDILNAMGVNAITLPGSDVYEALKEEKVDAAEFSAPAINLPLRFQDERKYVIEPGVHQPCQPCDLIVNKKKWDELPEQLQAVVKICARETRAWTYSWMESLNPRAIREIGKKSEYVLMDDATIVTFAETTHKFLEDLKAKNPDVKTTLESQERFRKDFAEWRVLRGRVTPWPYKIYIQGRLTQ